jgi:transcriptional regulator of acetoin/glycerol metabolism
LRVLQEREVVPLGGGKSVPVDFMLICATNRNLWDLVEAGTFRSDLYFRIAQYTIELSPLRQRPDRAQLVDELWNSLGARARRISLTPECREQLVSYEWPGNFRQLVGCLRAMLALCDPGDSLNLDPLPPDVRHGVKIADKVASPRGKAQPTLETIAATAMQDALRAAKGNVSLAARQLGVSRSTLYRRMQI